MILTNGLQKLEHIKIMAFSIHIYTTKYISRKKRILPSTWGKVYVTWSLISISYFRISKYIFTKQNLCLFKIKLFIHRILEKKVTFKMFFTFFDVFK